jgi:hypothetical protein
MNFTEGFGFPEKGGGIVSNRIIAGGNRMFISEFGSIHLNYFNLT